MRVFKLAFGCLTFSEIPKTLDTHTHKNLIFNTTAKSKCCKL